MSCSRAARRATTRRGWWACRPPPPGRTRPPSSPAPSGCPRSSSGVAERLIGRAAYPPRPEAGSAPDAPDAALAGLPSRPSTRSGAPMFLDPPLRRLLRNSGWLLASDAAVLAADLLVTVLVARALGVADFGRLGLVWTVVGTASLLVDVRAWEATTRYLSEFSARGQPGLALATLKLVVLVEAAVAIGSFGLAWAASGPVAAWLGDTSLGPLIVLGALTLVATAFDRAARAVLRVFDRFRALGFCRTLWALGRLGLVVGALSMEARVRGVLLAHVAADAGAAAILLAVAGREVRARLGAARASAGLGETRPYWREMLAFVG